METQEVTMAVQGKLLTTSDDLTEAFAIRKEVFLYELGMTEQLVFDEMDREAIHVIIYEDVKGENQSKDKIAVATGRLHFDGYHYELSQIAVLKDYRRKRYGDFAVRMLLNRAFQAGMEVITYSPNTLFQFFESIGFHKDNSEQKNGNYRMIINPSDIHTLCLK
jgi:N-acetylglutamate synthase-like GNAT family acetyltransferase